MSTLLPRIFDEGLYTSHNPIRGHVKTNRAFAAPVHADLNIIAGESRSPIGQKIIPSHLDRLKTSIGGDIGQNPFYT